MAADCRGLGGCGGGCSRRCRQSASARRWLTAVPGFVEALNSHGIGLEKLLNDVAVSIVKFTVEIGACKGGEIAHPIDEKLRVGDAVVLFELL